ncbi:hypothetical protein ACFXKC_54785 [Streptomyces sp. NPDC059340]|uniref:hypothetical protein n=1 Tax=Streptomyces sp. NPDC059340 TaxID=3346806 RepID=UPI0036AECE9B
MNSSVRCRDRAGAPGFGHADLRAAYTLPDDGGEGLTVAVVVARWTASWQLSRRGGPAPSAVAQLGGFSDQWQVAPEQDGLVLLAQTAGNGVDHTLCTMNLVVGAREDIAAGRWANLRYEQQY